MSDSLEIRFKKAAHVIRYGPAKPDATNEEKLSFYSLFKQATEGDVQGNQPWAVQLEARAKWDAWNSVKGMSKEDAMNKYVAQVSAQQPDFEKSPALANFKE